MNIIVIKKDVASLMKLNQLTFCLSKSMVLKLERDSKTTDESSCAKADLPTDLATLPMALRSAADQFLGLPYNSMARLPNAALCK